MVVVGKIMRGMTKIDGQYVQCSNESIGLLGLMPVFETAEQARQVYGSNVSLQEIDKPEKSRIIKPFRG